MVLAAARPRRVTGCALLALALALAATRGLSAQEPAPTDTDQAVAPAPAPGAEAAPPVAVPPPVVPRIDQGLKDRLRQVFLAGLDQGRRPGVFAKIGDSITASRYFLEPVGCGYVDLGPFADLAPTIDFFRQVEVPAGAAKVRCGLGNSFTRRGVSAVIGWTANHSLAPMRKELPECPPPDNNALKCELRSLSPSVALILYGSNDLDANDPERYYRALTALVQQSLDLRVIPVISTVPPRTDRGGMPERVRRYNEVVAQVAAEQQVPLWNYWLALQSGETVNSGLNRDGVHPNAYKLVHPGVFNPEGLRYGYNVRNLTALQVLDKLRKVVFEDGPAD